MRLTSTVIGYKALHSVGFGTSILILTSTGRLYSGVKYARVESKELGIFLFVFYMPIHYSAHAADTMNSLNLGKEPDLN